MNSEHLVLGLGLPLAIIVISAIAIIGMEIERWWHLRKRERMK